MDPPTVIALKQAFLELATRQLAQQLAPSRAWQRKNDLREGGHGIGAAINAVTATDGSGEDTGRRLPPKIVDDVLARVNQLLLLHARRVHPPAAVRHVAEQLDQLYQTVGDQLATAAPNESSNEALDRGLDYTTTSAIVGLPTTWDDLQESDALPLEARRYAEQVSELRSLAERRTTITARTRQLQEVAMALENVASSDNPPQHSLVTRDGPIETELERMRVLLARVGDRVSNLSSPVPNPQAWRRYADGGIVENAVALDSTSDVEEEGRQRARAVLGTF